MNATAPSYAVIDPDCKQARVWREAFGGDSVEMESERIWGVDKSRMFQVRVSAIGHDKLVHVCVVYARESGRDWQELFWEAVHGSGLWLDAGHVIVTQCPEEGRRFWSDFRIEGGKEKGAKGDDSR